jgi:lactate 2-monooxygenase
MHAIPRWWVRLYFFKSQIQPSTLLGVGTGIGFSDPVYTTRHNIPLEHQKPAFPYIAAAFDHKIASGDKEAQRQRELCFEWLREINHGRFRTWEDVVQLVKVWRGLWKEFGKGDGGEFIVKGIQNVEDAEKALEIGLSGIVVSNHGEASLALSCYYLLKGLCRRSPD